jgi:hypothetical protein
MPSLSNSTDIVFTPPYTLSLAFSAELLGGKQLTALARKVFVVYSSDISGRKSVRMAARPWMYMALGA